MNWLYYLLEANLYLAAFYLLYKLLLQNSTFYNSNRYFLIASILVAFATPLVQLGFLKPKILLTPTAIDYEIPLETLEISPIVQESSLTTEDYLLYAYLILAVVLAIKFLLSIRKIAGIYFHSKKKKLDGYTLVELSNEHTAFSFFNILFIHPSMVKNNTVLSHEMTHIKQKHSWDIVLLELLKICCWFNPVVYLMRKDLTLLHEYIADDKTTAIHITKHEYALFLIENSMAAYSSSVVNQLFNQSILKSRINMLNKEKTANWARLKYLLAVPLGVGLLCVSTFSFSKTYGILEIGTQKQVLQQKSQKATDEENLAKKGRYSPNYIFDENKNYKSLEKRLIVINGIAVEDNDKYYGSNKADKILFLDSKSATTKYGAKGKEGAIEIYGREDVLVYQPPYVIADTAKFPAPRVSKDQVKFPPPIVKPDKNTETPPLSPNPSKVKKDQVKFPPPIVKADKAWFTPLYKRDKATGKPILSENRYILINGKAVEDLTSFYGVSNADKVTYLTEEAAISKYGAKAKNGAVVITGKNIKYFDKVTYPKAPPVEPPPPGYKTKKGQVKFPPPIVKPDEKAVKSNRQKLAKEIEIASIKATATEEIEIVPSTKVAEKKVQEITIVKSEPISSKKTEEVRQEIDIQPIQKRTSELKIEKSTKPKTISITPVSKKNAVKEPAATTAKSTFQKGNNPYSKAWTLYKPKVVENKDDRC